MFKQYIWDFWSKSPFQIKICCLLGFKCAQHKFLLGSKQFQHCIVFSIVGVKSRFTTQQDLMLHVFIAQQKHILPLFRAQQTGKVGDIGYFHQKSCKNMQYCLGAWMICLSFNADGLQTYSSRFVQNFFSPIKLFLIHTNLSKKIFGKVQI